MMFDEMEGNLVDRRLLNRYRNHRLCVRTTLDVVLLILLPVLSIIVTGSISTFVSIYGDINIPRVVTATWITPSTTTKKTQRSAPHINQKNKIACWGNEHQRKLVLFSTPSSPTSNIGDKNHEDISSSQPPNNTLFLPSSSCKVDQLSGTDLAYIGDVVYELFIRTRTVWPLKRTSDLQQQVVGLVRAEHQSKLLHQLRQGTSSFVLTTKEEQVLNRGRNAAASRSSNNHRHHPIIYQDSTAFEALVGYLYISDTNRCSELFHWIESNVDTV